jgi:hypothetical protein
MVSHPHESILEMVRNHPVFGAALTGMALDGEMPRFTKVETVDPTFNEVSPVEYRADAVLLLRERKRPVFGIVVEAQLKPDRSKSFTWPLYAATARARYRCPFVVTVVTPSSRTERWASKAIDLGGGNHFRPVIVGPRRIPRVTDRDQARRAPQLAVLSAMAHGRGDVEIATAIGSAAVRAARTLPEPERLLYSVVITASLSEAARKALEMELDLYKFLDRGPRKMYRRAEAKGRAEGKAEGVAIAVTTILEQRGLKLTGEQRRQIVACRDQRRLDRWLKRASSVSSVAELLAPHARTARSSRSRAGTTAGRAQRAAR